MMSGMKRVSWLRRRDMVLIGLFIDYGYLEDVSRRADTLSRLNMKNDPQKLVSKNATAKQKELLKQTKRLGINLSMLPAGMKKRKLNCTNYAPK
jgi:hypothetical protein